MKNLKGFGLGLGTKMVTLMGKTWDKKGRPIKIRTADEYGMTIYILYSTVFVFITQNVCMVQWFLF